MTIYAVGDIMLGEQGLCYNFGVKSIIEKKGIDYLFRDVKGIFKGSDIVFGNLEAPISNYADKKGFEANFFRDNPHVLEGLRNANFNVLSVANNKSLSNKIFFQYLAKILNSNYRGSRNERNQN